MGQREQKGHEDSERQARQRLTLLHEVSIQLAGCESSDELCRQTVELGRMGVWVVDDDDPEYIRGAYGTDEDGAIRDEHNSRYAMADWGGLWEHVVQARKTCIIKHATPLHDHQIRVIGNGTQLIAPMWDGRQVAGAVCADDLLEPGSMTEQMSELLALFATMVGHLYTRRKAVEALAASEELHRSIVENAFDGINVTVYHRATGKRHVVSCNERYVEMSGRSREELFALDDLNSLFEEISADEYVEVAPGITKGTGISSWKRPDGKENYFEWSATSHRIADGYRILGADRDITERRKMEVSLRESEERFRTAFHAIPHAVYLVDFDRVITDVNETFLTETGYAREEVVGHKAAEFSLWKKPGDREQFLKELNEKGRVDNLEVLLPRRNGPAAAGLLSARIVMFDQEPMVLSITQDITALKQAEAERKLLDAQVQHTQKLESLGVLAGGIAHDFNNLLMAILGNADLALMELSSATPARGCLEEIERAAQRAAELCRQMLAYSGKGKFVVQPLDLNEVVEEIAHLLEVSISKRCALRYDFAHNLPAIDSDVTQLRQVIMNLITNASEAIEDDTAARETGGIISITTGAMDCDEEYLNSTFVSEGLKPGAYVFLEVQDTGIGMDEETKERVFEPFFTTKFTGRGLGMAAVLGIIRGHSGAVRIYSEPGRGSNFKILFPASDRPAEQSRPSLMPADGWRGEGTILLVDDEQTVRTVGKLMLERIGFNVLTASDGVQALELFDQNLQAGPDQDEGDKIVAVLLDLTMPNMDGEETFRELRRLQQDVRVILSSGYNEQEVTDRFAGKGLAGFIQKPYKSEALFRRVREALGGPGPDGTAE
ncbi:PAS domain S-box protein [Candidatus Sumerlaeota bacterium]